MPIEQLITDQNTLVHIPAYSTGLFLAQKNLRNEEASSNNGEGECAPID